MRVPSGKDARRDDRRRKRDARSSRGSGTAMLQFDVAVGGKEIAFLEDHEAGAAGGVVVVLVIGQSAFARVDVHVGSSLAAVAAGVGQGCEGRDADADDAGGDFGGAPEEDLGLVVGYVGAFARSDTDFQAYDAECRGAVDLLGRRGNVEIEF